MVRAEGDAHDAICEYCSELFAQAEPAIDVIRQPLREPTSIAPHVHEDAVQFTWLMECGGRALADGGWWGVTGRTALVSYPGERHGYELRPLSREAQVVLIKLPARDGSVLRRRRPLPHIATSVPPLPGFETAVDRLHRDVRPTRAAAARWMADAVGVVTRWPRSGSSQLAESQGADADPAIEDAVSLIERRIGDPPSLEEMAHAAHLSVRQFCRRFRHAVGVAPYQYVTERRIARARSLLFDTRLSSAAVAGELGFGSPAVFSRWFRKHEGRTPGQFRADPTRF
ncbi:MAG: AraC family transcriptional regulator [Planctomycetota bacterium]